MASATQSSTALSFSGTQGNFLLNACLDGDLVSSLEVLTGRHYRGLEKLFEQRSWWQNTALVSQLCTADPVPMEEGYARAVEKLAELRIPERAQWLRVLTLELSRICSHLLSLSHYAASIGLMSCRSLCLSNRDVLLDMMAMLTGSRTEPIYIVPGGVRRDLPDDFLKQLSRSLDRVEKYLLECDALLLQSPVLEYQSRQFACLTAQQAQLLGITGPNLRACGLPCDLRRDDPYLIYAQLAFEIPTAEEGDALARLQVRWQELFQSIQILRQVMTQLPQLSSAIRCSLPNPLTWIVPSGSVYTRTESARGELAFFVVSSQQQQPWRVQVRTPSMLHGTQLVEHLGKGLRLEELAQLVASLDLCADEMDR